LAEKSALRQHGVHQRGFAVIDVRNDGNIAREAIMLLRFAMIGRVTQDFRLHLLTNPRTTECGASELMSPLAVPAAPCALR
jgi:hypothetical protein